MKFLVTSSTDLTGKAVVKMFRHYNNEDFYSSPFTASAILNSKINSFSEFLIRELR